MSKVKTEILGSAISDFFEIRSDAADPCCRCCRYRHEGRKVVEYPLRGKKLLALTDEADGKVVVQPLNCIIDLSKVADADVKAATTGKTLDALKKEGDAYGIVYQGTPIA